jgi:hypothetical protein
VEVAVDVADVKRALRGDEPLAELLAAGLEPLPDPGEAARSVRRTAVKKRRVVDEVVRAELLASGWTFIKSLDGLQWCVACHQPTVWKNRDGNPMHHRCATDI